MTEAANGSRQASNFNKNSRSIIRIYLIWSENNSLFGSLTDIQEGIITLIHDSYLTLLTLDNGYVIL